jgi:formylmethanofuran dehydrogenase subunit B
VGHAWIDGNPVALEAAAAEAARLLSAARLPVIAGLGTDIAGARAAIALAQRLGGVIDHMHSDVLLRDLAVMRETGMMVTTANEARLRADTVLAIGGALFARPELAKNLLAPPAAPEVGQDVKRRVFRLCTPRRPTQAQAEIRTIGRKADELPALLASVRARVAGRPVNRMVVPKRTLDALAADLQAARFGVAVWSAAELDALAIEMLCGLIDDLNARTRFTGLPVVPGDNAVGVMQACGWMIGFPLRTGFGRGRPEHDPWHHDARRLIESREADCVLWVSAYGAAAPDSLGDVPMIALMPDASPSRPARPARVHIAVGRPGIDHDAVEHLAPTGTLTAVTARAPRDTISVAQAIVRIASAMPGADPC